LLGLAVKDTATKKEWVFLPDRWLALDEADHKTYGEFKPLTSTYPAGVVEGDRNSYNLTELSKTVFIVSSGIEEFYFTCGDGTKAMAVYRENGVLLGRQNPSGKKRVVPYIPENEWGVKFETSNLTPPQRFKVKVFSGNSQTEKWIWIFPAHWSTYPQVALRASLLFGLKDEVNKAEESNIFYCAKRIREYLAGLKADVVNASLPALNYGINALSIFGPSPDSLIQDTLSTVVEQYLENQEGVILRILGLLTSEAVSETIGLLTTLYDAYQWATEFPAILGTSVSEVYKVVLLKHLGGNYQGRGDQTLQQIDLLLQKAKDLVAESIQRLEANDAFACNEALTKLRTLVVGNNPSSNTLDDHRISYGEFGIVDLESGVPDYPLAILISIEMVAMKN